MPSNKDYADEFLRSFVLLEAGIRSLGELEPTRFFGKAREMVSSMLGGSLPTFDPVIGKIKANTNPLFMQPEQINKLAVEEMTKAFIAYNQATKGGIQKFKKVLDDIAGINKIPPFSDKAESDSRMSEIEGLSKDLASSEYSDGTIIGKSPKKISIDILELASSIIASLNDSFSSNKTYLNKIFKDLERDSFNASSIRPLQEIYTNIYLFDKIISIKKDIAVTTDKSKKDDKSSEKGAGAPSLDIRAYKPESFYKNDRSRSSLSTSFRTTTIAQRTGEPVLIPIVLVRQDGGEIKDDDIRALSDNSSKILKKLEGDGDIIINSDIRRSFVKNLENIGVVRGGKNSAILTIILNDKFLGDISNLNSGDYIIEIPSASGAETVRKANKQENLIKKSETATTSYYVVTSPSGEEIEFSVADLVKGRGKLKDSSGKPFTPKKSRGKTLADRVMSKSFGKVKK